MARYRVTFRHNSSTCIEANDEPLGARNDTLFVTGGAVSVGSLVFDARAARDHHEPLERAAQRP